MVSFLDHSSNKIWLHLAIKSKRGFKRHLTILNILNRRAKMILTGGCYCKELRYSSLGNITASIQCHCRECLYFTGGNANTSIIVPIETFKFSKGTPKSYERHDIKNPVIRLFCKTCGTVIGTKSPRRLNSINLKVGTLDNPSIFKPETAIFTDDKQDFHHIADHVDQFAKRP